MTITTQPSEQGHWYTKHGLPAYEIVGANGNKRATTLRDARKLGLLPSVTTIIRGAAAPGLELWKAKQVMLAALTLSRNPGETDDAYFARIMADSKEQARKAADRGTEIHAALEQHFEMKATDDPVMAQHIQGVVGQLDKHCGRQEWHAERSFAHSSGFGGKLDLHSDEWVIDFKTKEFGEDDELQTWDEHAMQLAAYDMGLTGTPRKGAIIYVSTTQPGLARFLQIPDEEMTRGWGMFEALLIFYKTKNNYYPEMA